MDVAGNNYLKGEMRRMLVFCEYVILPPYLNEFREWAGDRPSLWQGVQLLENVDQPGVMLEIRQAQDEEDAARIQKERLDGRSEWLDMQRWVKGGRAGVRVWTFRPVVTE